MYVGMGIEIRIRINSTGGNRLLACSSYIICSLPSMYLSIALGTVAN
jgi:hypothetical protein